MSSITVFDLQHSEGHEVWEESHGQSGEDVSRQVPVGEKREEVSPHMR